MDILKLISKPFRWMDKRIANFLSDMMELRRGERDSLTPPKRLIFIGDGDFKESGEEFMRYFKELCGLKPGESVLDIGCGIGRMAVPLARYLDRSARYEGFDIVKKGIYWCRNNITRKFPNFRFQIADIYNKNYNPRGKVKDAGYRFPYKDESFDFVFLTSVFTHMLPHGVENYLKEIRRTLKKNGRCLATFFLLNDESIPLVDSGKAKIGFKFIQNNYRASSAGNPEAAMAYSERFVRDLYERNALEIRHPIHYGSWCGRPKSLSYQDILIAVKR